MKKLVRVRTRFPNSCFRLSKARIRVRAPPLQSNPAYNSIHKADQKTNDLYENDYDVSVSGDTPRTEDGDTPRSADGENNGNRILVVIDSTKEAKGALEWALTHTVQKEDTVILLVFENLPLRYHLETANTRDLFLDDQKLNNFRH